MWTASGLYRRDYHGGNRLGTLPDGLSTRVSKSGGTMTVAVAGPNVTLFFDPQEAHLRGLPERDYTEAMD